MFTVGFSVASCSAGRDAKTGSVRFPKHNSLYEHGFSIAAVVCLKSPIHLISK